jgi:hypothetical protein
MGNFRIVIDSVGGHGCDRAAKEGESIAYKDDAEHLKYCPDCSAKKLVERYRVGWPDTKATLTHWPGEPSEVVDDLAAGVRVKGQF